LIAGLGYLLFGITLSQYSGISTLYPPGLSIFGSLSVFHSPLSMLILVLFYLGGLCKSAQFPFTQWLITAMTGPTPVSALIHAATMVNLGAILTFITYPFLINNASLPLYTFFEFMIGISVFTALYTSLNAMVSNEQKVILANSTADQISLMILSSSIGGLLTLYFHSILYLYTGISIGIIQMIGHGLYKASLFMNAGSVINYTGSRFIGEYPSLYKRLKSVFSLQLLASLNLASIPPLIGFWAHSFIASLVSFNPYLLTIYMTLEFFTAIYIIRYLVKTFLWRNENLINIGLLYKTPKYDFAYSYSSKPSHEEFSDLQRKHSVDKLMVISPALLITLTIISGVTIFAITKFMTIQMLTINSFLSFNVTDVTVSLLGALIAAVIFSRNIQLRFLTPIVNLFYTGFYIYPLLDKLGLGSLELFNKTYESLEYGIYTTLNLKLPIMIRRFGSWSVNKVQSGVLRNYVGFYIVGVIMLLVILLIIL
jgi:NADH-quinone oxidoreductase subunit L/M